MQEKLRAFCNEFNHFHDSYIKEIRISNAEYLDEDNIGHGHADGFQFNIEVLFQRPTVDGADAVQVSFKEVVDFHLTSPRKGFSSEIGSAELKEVDGNIYFATADDWRQPYDSETPSIWILAKSVDWFREKGQLGRNAMTRVPEPVDEVLTFAFVQTQEIRMGSPYHTCEIRFYGQPKPSLPTTGYQDVSSQSLDGAHFALVQWDIVDNEPGFKVVIVNRATAESRESSRIEGCCEELEFKGNQVIVKSASGKKVRIPVG